MKLARNQIRPAGSLYTQAVGRRPGRRKKVTIIGNDLEIYAVFLSAPAAAIIFRNGFSAGITPVTIGQAAGVRKFVGGDPGGATFGGGFNSNHNCKI